MKMKKIELMGCLSRIRNCSVDILTLEEIVNEKQEQEEEEMWDLIKRELQLKTTFLYFDLNRVISSSKDEHKEVLTKLANQFFHCIQELTDATKSRSVPITQLCFNDTAIVLHEIMDALVPSPSY
ncbi:Photosynthetic NDH subunit of lumenal location 3 [Carex littledalei]|uniref:Photosynthetic NDH subunit of lumenal location 3 n=1 Tax=Carex littledalei TaxID=544730 RepID=A0A833QGH1_9POAL|nr:Photosynthetic NDH subunit of lumenal location 3 [Carex littledalei]